MRSKAIERLKTPGDRRESSFVIQDERFSRSSGCGVLSIPHTLPIDACRRRLRRCWVQAVLFARKRERLRQEAMRIGRGGHTSVRAVQRRTAIALVQQISVSGGRKRGSPEEQGEGTAVACRRCVSLRAESEQQRLAVLLRVLPSQGGALLRRDERKFCDFRSLRLHHSSGRSHTFKVSSLMPKYMQGGCLDPGTRQVDTDQSRCGPRELKLCRVNWAGCVGVPRSACGSAR
ncbi:hypothetical protein OF846_001387 [Rhodotorula toruloides]|nr:hypothetical protein OF846_001387 [Rhodotorula toruloides]